MCLLGSDVVQCPEAGRTLLFGCINSVRKKDNVIRQPRADISVYGKVSNKNSLPDLLSIS